MVQKAKLDILENLPDVETPDININAEVMTEQLPVTEVKWAFNKLLLIGVPISIVILIAAGSLWFYLARTVSPVARIKPTTPVASISGKEQIKRDKMPESIPVEPIKMNTAYLKDFIIDLKDKTGKSKIFQCDVALDLYEKTKIAELENRKDVRFLIYQAAKGKNALALKSLEERKRFKKELSSEMNKMLGGDIVKNVYFMNYVIM
jgi:flagellar basal body-associated protein FliL